MVRAWRSIQTLSVRLPAEFELISSIIENAKDITLIELKENS
ncbi:hypothetical protein PF003_g23682 [Phytophthora fragariae]|nr:hypothetical protein PF003_g23682 [Phytophthora fragariae]